MRMVLPHWLVVVFLLGVVSLTSSAATLVGPQEVCPFASAIEQLPSATAGMWRENRIRLVTLARPSLAASSLIFLTGDLDTDLDRNPFRTNSNFYYVSGANLPGVYISLYVTTANPTPVTTLFVPQPSADYPVWNGHVYTKEELRVMYDVDEVLYTNELAAYVARFPAASTTVFTIASAVALPSQLNIFTINRSTLASYITTARATKSNKEIALMTVVNDVSSYAHISAMKFVASRLNTSTVLQTKQRSSFMPFHRVSPPLSVGSVSASSYHVPMDDVAKQAIASNFVSASAATVDELKPKMKTAAASLYEYEVESEFTFQSGLCGALQQSYLPIVGAGNNGAILHYIANNDVIVDGEMLLIDAGAEYWGYGSDITRTYPVNGKFSPSQTLIYNIVLQAQADVVAAVKPGVTWNELNSIARVSLTTYALQAGLLQGSLQDLLNNNVIAAFYPHGVGHSLGLDVHDSQTNVITQNQVITVEPGIYFNAYLLDAAQRNSISKFIAWETVNTFRGTGGVRIEDDFVVTATGAKQLTSVPSNIAAIEQLMGK